MTANNDAAPNAIRLNLARGPRAELVEKLKAEGFEVGASGRAPETIVLSSAANFESSAYRDGLFHAQSEASQMTARMLAPRADATVVDCAAAPGGKATHLAEIVGERGRVIAVDVNLNGLKNARALARRLRHRNVDFVCADLTAAAPLRESSFDYVLLDAPCTGIGTLREHPEIKWRLKPSDPARMAAIQSRMLETCRSAGAARRRDRVFRLQYRARRGRGRGRRFSCEASRFRNRSQRCGRRVEGRDRCARIYEDSSGRRRPRRILCCPADSALDCCRLLLIDQDLAISEL